MTRRMFIAAIAATLIATNNVSGEEVQKDKLYVMCFSARWCQPCLRMKKAVWPKKSVQDALKKFNHAVDKDGNITPHFVDTDNQPEIAKFYGVNGKITR